MRLFALVTIAGALAIATPAAAQISIGVGGGTGIGNRGGSAKATHGVAFAELDLPVVPAVRAEVIGMDAPSGVGKLSIAVSAVISAPLPIVRPYAIVGWGRYGVDKTDTAQSGWNAGVGVRASFAVGVFAEYRRHQRIARDLITVGVTF